MDLGMDVHPRLGLVAAADETGTIKIWNMYTTEVVKSFPGRVRDQRIRCVRFVDEEDGRASLWANVKGGITRFGW